MIKINVLSEDVSWSKKLKNKEIFFNNLCKYFPKKFKFVNKKIYLTLLLSNNKNIRKLNKVFRNKDKHTDILSFPFQKNISNQKKIFLGDIIISFNYMNEPKDLNNREFKIKVVRIFIHGFLHLLGFDHIKEKDYKKMFKQEKKIFNTVQRKI